MAIETIREMNERRRLEGGSRSWAQISSGAKVHVLFVGLAAAAGDALTSPYRASVVLGGGLSISPSLPEDLTLAVDIDDDRVVAMSDGAVYFDFSSDESDAELTSEAAEALDISSWPAPSARPTTSATARALEAHTKEDPEPRLPPLETDDGYGI